MLSSHLDELLRLRPASEYHEDMGPVLWWNWPITEPPYVGGPNDCGHTIELHSYSTHLTDETPQKRRNVTRLFVGPWPDYHAYWSPLPEVREPEAAAP